MERVDRRQRVGMGLQQMLEQWVGAGLTPLAGLLHSMSRMRFDVAKSLVMEGGIRDDKTIRSITEHLLILILNTPPPKKNTNPHL